MTVRMGAHRFDSVVYDAERDVLYMRKGKPGSAMETLASTEGHAVRLNDAREIIGITVVNAKWLAERDGRITVTILETTHPPERLESPAADLAAALAA